tara:strand:- start:663 stop:1655 length:993 start_codon:yes stop_codon:yes gene_type:complete
MFDIIFDFSSSPKGGSYRRIEAYAAFFSDTKLKILFLLHPTAAKKISKSFKISIDIIEKSNLEKFLSRNSYLDKYKGRCKWLFSYGIPLSNPVGNQNWFHVSNILPFQNKNIKLNFFTRVKSLFLMYYIYKSKDNLDVISAESHFSLNVIKKYFSQKKFIHLSNGFLSKNINISKSIYSNYAIAVGTAKYKRIDITYSLFLKVKDSHKVKTLIILGSKKEVPSNVLKDKRVKVIEEINDVEYFSILKNSTIFISTSEIENSSVAVMEAMQFCNKMILSNIPSHLELFTDKQEKLNINNQEYLLINNKDILISYSSKWSDTISIMLKEMQL